MAAYVPLDGSQRTLLPGSRPAGPIDASEIATLTVRVRAKGDVGALSKKAYELAGQPLDQRVYLDHAALEEQFGARQEDLDAVERFAQQHDLMVVHRNAAQRTLVLKGSLRNLLSVFHADLQMYHHASGTYRGRRGKIRVPEALQGIVTGVFGFDTRRKHRAPHRQKRMAHGGPGDADGVPATAYATRYAFPTAEGDMPLDGTGQTIAIIELGGVFRNDDLAVYFQRFGIPTPQITSVSIDHGGSAPSPEADAEVMLDIEVVGTVVPKAKLVVYFAPNTGNQGFLDALNAAVHDTQRSPSVISISWGSPEVTMDQQTLEAFHEIFSAAAASGITICVASGDYGSADGPEETEVLVDHPACDDLVLACGGTQIENEKDVVWNDRNAPDRQGMASGGGISQTFSVPAYQQALNMPASLAGDVGRGVPDIAMCATKYAVRFNGSDDVSGGTSAVAPLMAALVARLNQATGKRVGFINPLLYGTAGLTVDVTEGDNSVKRSVPGYAAGPGWDACTGLGTPNGTAILSALLGGQAAVARDIAMAEVHPAVAEVADATPNPRGRKRQKAKAPPLARGDIETGEPDSRPA